MNHNLGEQIDKRYTQVEFAAVRPGPSHRCLRPPATLAGYAGRNSETESDWREDPLSTRSPSTVLVWYLAATDAKKALLRAVAFFFKKTRATNLRVRRILRTLQSEVG